MYDVFKDDHIFSAYDIQVWKPKPDLYLGIAELFNLKAENCIVVEDSVSGASAAQAAGMKCYGYARDTKANEFLKVGAIPINHMNQIRDDHPGIFNLSYSKLITSR